MKVRRRTASQRPALGGQGGALGAAVGILPGCDRGIVVPARFESAEASIGARPRSPVAHEEHSSAQAASF